MALAYQGKEVVKFICRECGEPAEAIALNAAFCSRNCTNSYDRRRARRAIQLYDVFMEMRYRRQGSKGLWTLMCRLAEEWRDEDARIRRGLQSWKDPKPLIEKRPYMIGKRGRI